MDKFIEILAAATFALAACAPLASMAMIPTPGVMTDVDGRRYVVVAAEDDCPEYTGDVVRVSADELRCYED